MGPETLQPSICPQRLWTRSRLDFYRSVYEKDPRTSIDRSARNNAQAPV